jgi:hypothetical protein
VTGNGDQAQTLAELSEAADALAPLIARRKAEMAARDALIVQARSEGYSWRTIARASGRSIARCVAIVDRSF